jgi:WD40 repeat protein
MNKSQRVLKKVFAIIAITLMLLNIQRFVYGAATDLSQGDLKVERKFDSPLQKYRFEQEFSNSVNAVYGISSVSKLFAICNSVHRIDVWDVERMQFKKSFYTEQNDILPRRGEPLVRGIAFSIDGKKLFVTEYSRDQNGFIDTGICKLYIFDIETNALISKSELKIPNHTSIICSPNGLLLAFPCVDSVYIYDLDTKKLLSFDVKNSSSKSVPGTVRICQFSNDSHSIYATTGLSTNSGSDIFEFDLKSRKVIHTFSQGYNSGLYVDSIGKALYSPNMYGELSSWDRISGQLLSKSKMPANEGIWSCAYLSGSNSLLLGGVNTLKFYSLSDSKFSESIYVGKIKNGVKSIAVTPDNKMASVATENGLVSVDLITKVVKSTSEGFAIETEKVEMLTNKFSISTDKYKGLKIWDVDTGKLKMSLNGALGNTRCGVFDQSGKFLYAGGDDGIVRVWDISRGVIDGCFSVGPYIVSAVGISPDGKFLAVGDSKGLLRIMDTATRIELFKFDNYATAIRSLSFSENGKFLAIGLENGRVVSFEIPGFKRLKEIEVSKEPIFAISFLSASNEFVIGDDSSKMIIINAVTGSIMRSQRQSVGKEFTALSISEDGKYIVTSCGDEFIRVFDAIGLKEIQVIKLPARVWSLCFIGNSYQLICGCENEEIRICEIGKNETIMSDLSSVRIPISMAVTRDGKRVAYFGQSGTVVLKSVF